jgi:hypothetical protein
VRVLHNEHTSKFYGKGDGNGNFNVPAHFLN